MRTVVALLLLVACLGFAQTDRGTITGLITDPAGAVVANAQIEAKNSETGSVYPAISSATGNYTLAQMPTGVYEITVKVPGFKQYVRQNIRVNAAQTIGVDIALEVGAASESVTVSADVSLLKTESSDVAYNIDGNRIVQLPILPIGNGFSSSHGVRNPMAVSGLAPGTFFDPNLNIKVNGAPSNTEAIHIDGQDATNGVVTFSQAQTQPSVEALQELSIQTSNYAAEYGQAGAGLFNYTTKSGTNQYHGSLYNYNANEAYNSSQTYTHFRPSGGARRNNFGGTLGGPIVIPKIYNGHDKTFFFFNYEAFKETGLISNQSPTVPTDLYRAGNFTQALSNRPITGLPVDSLGRVALDGQIFDPSTETRDAQGRRLWNPFPGNIIPTARLDPSAVRLLSLIPRPTSAGLVNNYNVPYPTDRYTAIPAVKIDHNIGSRAKISGYWSRTTTSVQYCTPLCGSDGLPDPITATRGTFIESHTERINFDYTITPTLLFHLGAGFITNDFKDTAPTTNFDVAGVLGIRGVTVGPSQGARFPIFSMMTGLNSTGGMSNMGPAAGQVRAIEYKPTFNASVTWVKSNHTYKYGGDFRLDGFTDQTFTNTTGQFQFNAQQTGNPYFLDAGIAQAGGVTGFPFASVMLGRVNQANIAALSKFRGGRNYLGIFAQDTWKVSRKLTLDYGLRYDYSTYSREQYGRAPFFSPNVANATAGGHPGGAIYEGNGPNRCNCNLANNYPFAFGPRVGVAYQINEKTVLRAGFGVNYSAYTGGRYTGAPGANNEINAPGAGDPAMILSGGITNQGVPFTPIWPDMRANLFPLPGTTSAPNQFQVMDNNRGRPARQAQWSIGLQREIFRNLVAEAAYVGNRGAWWATNGLLEYNALTPELLRTQYGLDIYNAADRAILATQLRATGAGRFQNRLPYNGFPTTASVAQSLRPFPQFGNITGPAPLGKTWYDSLQAKVTQRLWHGLELTYNFTWAKELQLGADTDGGIPVGQNQVNDIFNRNTNKTWSSFSRPFWNTLAINYTVPKYRGNKWASLVLSDWYVGSVLSYGSGMPIPVPATAQAASNLMTTLLRGTRAERVPGEPLFLQDLNCHCFDPAQTQVLNPRAWRDPVPGTFSPSAYFYNDYRYMRRPQETLSLGRWFNFTERVRLQVRMDFNNVTNRARIPNPLNGAGVVQGGVNQGNYTTAINRNAGITSTGTLQVNNTGFGVIPTLPTNAVIGERSGLLVARLQF